MTKFQIKIMIFMSLAYALGQAIHLILGLEMKP